MLTCRKFGRPVESAADLRKVQQTCRSLNYVASREYEQREKFIGLVQKVAGNLHHVAGNFIDWCGKI